MNSSKLDQSLWNDIRAGNQQAFSTLFFKYSDLLLNYGYLIVKDRELIKDCIQELFLDIWRRQSALPELEKVRYYLLRAFRRVLFRRMKQDEQRRYDHTIVEDMYELPREADIAQSETEHLRRQYLAGKVNALPKRQREIVYLKYYEDMSYEEICGIMGIQHQAAWNLISRAVKTLKSMVGDRQALLFLFSLFLLYA
jgi:RNA polymerase sigma factor (sigma-70 family)